MSTMKVTKVTRVVKRSPDFQNGKIEGAAILAADILADVQRYVEEAHRGNIINILDEIKQKCDSAVEKAKDF